MDVEEELNLPPIVVNNPKKGKNSKSGGAKVESPASPPIIYKLRDGIYIEDFRIEATPVASSNPSSASGPPPKKLKSVVVSSPAPSQTPYTPRGNRARGSGYRGRGRGRGMRPGVIAGHRVANAEQSQDPAGFARRQQNASAWQGASPVLPASNNPPSNPPTPANVSQEQLQRILRFMTEFEGKFGDKGDTERGGNQ